jgi:proline iminopeptidase
MKTTNILQPGHHMVDVAGLAQSCHVAGSGPVCVVHPGGPGIDWAYLRMPRLEAFMTMVYLEPIGTGLSGRLATHPQGYTVERYSAQLDGFLEALDLGHVFLLGHSHGGFVAQHHALAHPERLRGLILYDSAAVTGPAFMQAADAAVRQAASAYEDRDLAAEVLAAWASIPSIRDDASYTAAMRGLLPAYFADPLSPAIATLRDGLTASFVVGDNAPIDVRETLRDLHLPTLVIVGTQDFICGEACGDVLQQVIPTLERVDIPDAGHFAHIEQADDFAASVRAFVLRHPPG